MHTLDLSGCIELLTTNGDPAYVDFIFPVLDAQVVHGGVRELLLSTPASWASGHGFSAMSVERLLNHAPTLTRLKCTVQVGSSLDDLSYAEPEFIFGPDSSDSDRVRRRSRFTSFLKDLAVHYDAELGYDSGCVLVRTLACIPQLETLFLRRVLRLDVRFLFPLRTLSHLTLVSCNLTEDALPPLAHLVGRLSSLCVSTSAAEFASTFRDLFVGDNVTVFTEAVRLSSLQELRLFANGQRIWDVVVACAGHRSLRALLVDTREMVLNGKPLADLVPTQSALAELVLKSHHFQWETMGGFFEAVARSLTLRKMEIGPWSEVVANDGDFYGPDEAFEEGVIMSALRKNGSLEDAAGLIQQRPWKWSRRSV
jgi:hypothetical protein